MSAFRDFNWRLRAAAWPISVALLVAYFAYHVVQGRHGLLSYLQLRAQVAEAEQLAGHLAAERAALERRVAGLRPDRLDPDLLDETVRRELLYVHPDELVILLD